MTGGSGSCGVELTKEEEGGGGGGLGGGGIEGRLCLLGAYLKPIALTKRANLGATKAC